MVRLLPPGHPYLDPQNMGRFNIVHVVSQAASNLKWSRKNIDQIFIFFTLIAAIILLIAQFIMLAYSYLIEPALATSAFVTPTPEKDIALNFMVDVFGLPTFFCEGAACPDDVAALGVPTPFHTAMQIVFRFYNQAILIIAVLIFVYYIFVVVVETATTGTPFGERFQSFWAPIRLVVALGLLIPLNYGYNTSQYIVLTAAKWGSGFATNGWNVYNDTILTHKFFSDGSGGQNPTGEKYSLIGLPGTPLYYSFSEAMSIIHTCAYAYLRLKPDEIDGTPGHNLIANSDTIANIAGLTRDPDADIKPYLVKNSMASYLADDPDTDGGIENREPLTASTTYQDALAFSDYGNIVIRWGVAQKKGDKHYSDLGSVDDKCGEITIPVTDRKHAGQNAGATPTLGTDPGGSDLMLKRYFQMVQSLWFEKTVGDDSDKYAGFAVRMFETNYGTALANSYSIACHDSLCTADMTNMTQGANGGFLPDCTAVTPPLLPKCALESVSAQWTSERVMHIQSEARNDVVQAWAVMLAYTKDTEIDASMKDYGWGGAGIWYNKIAEVNGTLIDGVKAIPYMSRYPEVMEQVRAKRRQQNADSSGIEFFNPKVKAGSKAVTIEGNIGIASVLYQVYALWYNDGVNKDDVNNTGEGNVIEDTIMSILGLGGLMDIRGDNQYVHPLAQLAIVGKSLIDSTIMTVGLATAASVISGFDRSIANISKIVSGFAMSIAFIGLTAGLVLYYVIPFMPFIYFFFALAEWIKAIFEAMAGAPLWAAAHLRIDGNGLPGDSAMNGYYLILDIFIRPILTIAGLIAAITIMAAQVRVLNLIWDLVVTNHAGYTSSPMFGSTAHVEYQRKSIDQFFFTVIYTIIVYLIATSSFKLINSIPDHILRWMGGSVSTFGDMNQDPTSSINRYVSIGGMTMGQQLTQGMQSGAEGVGKLGGGLWEMVSGGGGKGQGGLKPPTKSP